MKTVKALKNQLKRAFTIVELVIVIAVIAILAAVLIPTFANLINSAEESNDMVLVSNINKIVAAYDTTGNIDTVNDALDGVLENGYSVSALTPTSDGNVIVYDANSNRFALLTENALTDDATEDDVIYTDSTTTKTDWTTSTTWVFVKLSDVTANSSNVYDLTSQSNSAITGTNSYILTGTDDWAGKNVKVTYGVSLYDYTNTITLASVNVVNTSTNAQTEPVSYNESNTKTAVSKTTIANTKSIDTIVVNVKALYLKCDSAAFTVKNYSETTITAVVGTCNLSEYGTTTVYDATEITTGKITNYNSKISEDVVVNVSSGTSATSLLSDSTNTITVSTVTTTTVKIEVETTAASVTITVDGSEITSTDSSTGTTTVTLELGTEKYPYTITSDDDLSDLTSGYYKLTGNYETSSVINISSGKEIYLDLNGYILTSTYGDSNNITNSSALTISNGTLSFNSMGAVNTGALVAETSSKITLNNVEATTNGSMLYPSGDAAEVNVIDSTIYTTGAYCIATNASTVYTCTISIDNSTLQVKGTTALCINVDVTVNINNSTIIAGEKGVDTGSQTILLRAGTITMTDSTVLYYRNGANDAGAIYWGNGNDAPRAAIVIGDATDSYKSTNAELKMTNCTVNVVDYTSGEVLSGLRAIYMYGKDEDGYKSSLAFDSNTTINGQLIVGAKADSSTNNVTYECSLVTINNESYTTAGTTYTVSGTTLSEVN